MRHPLYQAAYAAAERLIRHNDYLGFDRVSQAPHGYRAARRLAGPVGG